MEELPNLVSGLLNQVTPKLYGLSGGWFNNLAS